jgi:hypothetical protein
MSMISMILFTWYHFFVTYQLSLWNTFILLIMLLRENESEIAILFTFPLCLFSVKIKLKNTIQTINLFVFLCTSKFYFWTVRSCKTIGQAHYLQPSRHDLLLVRFINTRASFSSSNWMKNPRILSRSLEIWTQVTQ